MGVFEGHAILASEGGGGHGRARRSGVAGASMITYIMPIDSRGSHDPPLPLPYTLLLLYYFVLPLKKEAMIGVAGHQSRSRCGCHVSENDRRQQSRRVRREEGVKPHRRRGGCRSPPMVEGGHGAVRFGEWSLERGRGKGNIAVSLKMI